MCGALRHIGAMLTTQFLKVSNVEDPQDAQVIRNLMRLNMKLVNFQYTDRLLRAMAKIKSASPKDLVKDIVDNLEYGAKNSVTLIP